MPFAFDIRYISLSKAEGTKIGSRIRDSEERGRKHGYRPSLFESSNSVVLRPCVSLLVNKNKYRLEARPLHDDDHQNHGRGGYTYSVQTRARAWQGLPRTSFLGTTREGITSRNGKYNYS